MGNLMDTALKKDERATEAKSLIMLYPHASEGNDFLKQLKKQYEGDASIEVQEPKSEKEIIELVRKFGAGLIVFCIRNKEDFTLVLNCTVSASVMIKRRYLRLIGVNHIQHPSVPEMLLKRGCTDIFPPNASAKSIKHKITQSLKILETYRVVGEGAPKFTGQDVKQAEKSGSPKSASKAPVSTRKKHTIEKVSSLTLKSDCWLLRKERDIRQVQGRWIVDLVGPGPCAGLWEETGQNSGFWEWKTKPLPESVGDIRDFVKDEGLWVFSGRKPEFVWDLGRWRFLGDAPELSFIFREKVLACRFKVIGMRMEYAENSDYARAKLPLIIRTIENEVTFKKETLKHRPDKSFEDEKKESKLFDISLKRDQGKETLMSWEEDAPDEPSPELSIDLGPRDEGRELEIDLGEEPEPAPFNEAPKPKLKVWLDTGTAMLVDATPIEIAESTLVVEVPSKKFAAGQSLHLIMNDGLKGKNSESRVPAVLKLVEPLDGETDLVTVQIQDGVKISLEPIQKAFEERQAEIQNFLKAARGW
jgi:hypothetical protein